MQLISRDLEKNEWDGNKCATNERELQEIRQIEGLSKILRQEKEKSSPHLTRVCRHRRPVRTFYIMIIHPTPKRPSLDPSL